MMILYSPQLNENNTLEYTFEGDKITAIFNGISDTFDFTGMPDGSIVNSYDRFNPGIVSTLPINPIMDAVRDNGVLKVRLIKYITSDAPESEKFPDWVEV